MNLNCSSENFHSAGLQRISFITSRVNMSPRVLNSFYVPAVSFFISAKMGKSYSNNFSNEKNFLRSLNLLRETWKRSTLLGRMSFSCQALDLFQKGPKGATSRRMRPPILLNSRHHSDDSYLSGFECDLSPMVSPMASGPEVRFQEKHLSTKD